MASPVIVDTGPLVASLVARDQYHEWAKAQICAMIAPMVTCEAVLSEAFFLLDNISGGRESLSSMINRGNIEVRFDFQDERESTLRLLKKYADLPMSFADACIVRMSEMNRQARVFTLDRDFLAYRRNGRERIALIAPWQH